ncbi:PAS-domain containing protein [Variovorax defluvii]
MHDAPSLPAEALGRYQTLQAGLDLLDQGLSIFDGDLRLVAWNTAYVRLLDFPEDMAYLGAPFESFIRYNAKRGEYGPGDPEALVAERVEAARGFESHEIERTRPDGRVLRIRGMPLPGHGFVTLYSDVTAQRAAERTILEQNAELESRVAARTGELLREQKRSQELIARAQKLEALGQLTGGLAHDFNNILTVVIGNLAALARVRGDDPLVPEFVQPALDASRRGADLVKGLLSFARRQPLKAVNLDVCALLESTAKLVRRSLPESLSLDILDILGTRAPVRAWIDAGLLEQALLNLLLNARDAARPGGRIQIGATQAVLDAPAAQALHVAPGPYAHVQVRDDGAGMDAHTLAHIFEPFFTTKQAGRGSGLGMAMVYGFIKQSGGAIEVRSAPGQGTTVSLWLPAGVPEEAQAAAPAPAPAPSEAVPSAERGLALLVDDDDEVRRVVRRDLLALGYSVLEAGNGAEALSLLARTDGIVLLLSDVSMPGGVDGREVARAAREGRRAHAVVLMSGYAPGDLRVPGVPLLAKPFTRAQLDKAIEASKR